jgi:hypothetical protein
MPQDGFVSEMREIEKSVYIAADVELTRCDAEDSKEYGKAWGGASAGDIVGAPRVSRHDKTSAVWWSQGLRVKHDAFCAVYGDSDSGMS